MHQKRTAPHYLTQTAATSPRAVANAPPVPLSRERSLNLKTWARTDSTKWFGSFQAVQNFRLIIDQYIPDGRAVLGDDQVGSRRVEQRAELLFGTSLQTLWNVLPKSDGDLGIGLATFVSFCSRLIIVLNGTSAMKDLIVESVNYAWLRHSDPVKKLINYHSFKAMMFGLALELLSHMDGSRVLPVHAGQNDIETYGKGADGFALASGICNALARILGGSEALVVDGETEDETVSSIVGKVLSSPPKVTHGSYLDVDTLPVPLAKVHAFTPAPVLASRKCLDELKLIVEASRTRKLDVKASKGAPKAPVSSPTKTRTQSVAATRTVAAERAPRDPYENSFFKFGENGEYLYRREEYAKMAETLEGAAAQSESVVMGRAASPHSWSGRSSVAFGSPASKSSSPSAKPPFKASIQRSAILTPFATPEKPSLLSAMHKEVAIKLGLRPPSEEVRGPSEPVFSKGEVKTILQELLELVPKVKNMARSLMVPIAVPTPKKYCFDVSSQRFEPIYEDEPRIATAKGRVRNATPLSTDESSEKGGTGESANAEPMEPFSSSTLLPTRDDHHEFSNARSCLDIMREMDIGSVDELLQYLDSMLAAVVKGTNQIVLPTIQHKSLAKTHPVNLPVEGKPISQFSFQPNNVVRRYQRPTTAQELGFVRAVLSDPRFRDSHPDNLPNEGRADEEISAIAPAKPLGAMVRFADKEDTEGPFTPEEGLAGFQFGTALAGGESGKIHLPEVEVPQTSEECVPRSHSHDGSITTSPVDHGRDQESEPHESLEENGIPRLPVGENDFRVFTKSFFLQETDCEAGLHFTRCVGDDGTFNRQFRHGHTSSPRTLISVARDPNGVGARKTNRTRAREALDELSEKIDALDRHTTIVLYNQKKPWTTGLHPNQTVLDSVTRHMHEVIDTPSCHVLSNETLADAVSFINAFKKSTKHSDRTKMLAPLAPELREAKALERGSAIKRVENELRSLKNHGVVGKA